MDNRLITIGIPFYNAGEYLYYAVCSVLNQSYTNWELILLDDGSTDDSLKIAKSFNDARISIISDGLNKGLVYRLNQSVFMAKGEFYARMDADDVMHFDRLRIQSEFLELNPDVDVVGSNYYTIDSNNDLIGLTTVNMKPDSLKSVLQNGCFAHPSILGKTQWFRNNPYNENCLRMEDLELWLRTVEVSKFKNIDEPLLFYRTIGIPTLRKYINSNVGIIKLLHKRDNYKISYSDSVYFSFVYLLKIIVYVIFFCFGKMDILIKKRSKRIDNEAMPKAIDYLNKSLNYN